MQFPHVTNASSLSLVSTRSGSGSRCTLACWSTLSQGSKRRVPRIAATHRVAVRDVNLMMMLSDGFKRPRSRDYGMFWKGRTALSQRPSPNRPINQHTQKLDDYRRYYRYILVQYNVVGTQAINWKFCKCTNQIADLPNVFPADLIAYAFPERKKKKSLRACGTNRFQQSESNVLFCNLFSCFLPYWGIGWCPKCSYICFVDYVPFSIRLDARNVE